MNESKIYFTQIVFIHEGKADFEQIKMDEERKSFLHLFKESVKKVILIEGAEISR